MSAAAPAKKQKNGCIKQSQLPEIMDFSQAISKES
jgi:hypothetical protein